MNSEDRETLRLAVCDCSDTGRDGDCFVRMDYDAPGLEAAVDRIVARVVETVVPLAGQHDNNGLCPDSLEGWDSRDPGCAACHTLMELTGTLPSDDQNLADWKAGK